MPGEMTEETSEYQSEYMSRWVVITRSKLIWIVTMKAQSLTRSVAWIPFSGFNLGQFYQEKSGFKERASIGIYRNYLATKGMVQSA